MRQKGFTLAELIGVIVVLAMISLVTVPAVTTSLNKYKIQLCTTQLNNIESAARTWGADNLVLLPDQDGNSIRVTLGTLSQFGYIDEEIKNPISKEPLDLESTYVTITRKGKKLIYEIDETTKNSCTK